MDVIAEVRGERRPLPPAVDRSAYRILQEALTNAARHGNGARGRRGRLRAGALAARGDESGERQRRRTRAGGHGTPGMRERAGLLGGTLDAAARDGRFEVRARLPLRRPARMSEQSVRVLVVDDDDLMRAGLRGVLSTDEAIEVVGESGDGRDAIYRTRLLQPDVVLMDVRMPDLDGISATRELLAAFPEVKVVILTTFEQDDYIFGALQRRRFGLPAQANASRRSSSTAVHTIAAGDSLLSPSVTSRVIERMATQPQPDPAVGDRLSELTPRELEVLRLIADGLSNSEIGATLVIEESTVKTHVKRVLAKLDARDRVQAVIVAYQSGLTPPTSGD